MSLNKAIERRKEKRQPYRGAKSVDTGCRNHGDCAYCTNNRLFKKKTGKGKIAVVDSEFDYWDERYSY